jgi:hypothetical protein
MMRVYIEGRQLDLHEGEALQVTREIADIREPDARSSDWSKTYRIPGTANNNRIFGHIFDINQEQLNTGTQFAPDFNPNKKAAALVTVDEVEQVRGYMRLLNINVIRRGEIEYEVSVHGVAADLFAKIRNKKLSEIDLSEFNHNLSKTEIKDSWSHNAADGYVYPMIDRGRQNKPYNVWGCEDFTPAVFAKVVVDRIFSAAGYTYTADSFFNSDEFKARVIPFPKLPQLSEATINGFAARARRSTDVAVTIGTAIPYNDDSSSGYFDNGGNFDTATGKYESPYTGVLYTVEASIEVEVTGISSILFQRLQVEFGVYTGGRLAETFTTGQFTNQAIIGGNITFEAFGNGFYTLANDEIEIRPIRILTYDISNPLAGWRTATGGTVTIKANSTIEINAAQSAYGIGLLVDFNSMFTNGDWTQDKFLSDLIKMDNLYIESTGRSGELFIAPRESFYRDTVVHDLTAKIDRSQPVTIRPMGELDANPYIFTMAAGKDGLSDEYQKAIGKPYGEARVIVDNDFIRQEKKIETTFAGTPYNHAGGRFVIASMAQDGNSAGELRMLYWSGKVTNNTWTLCDAVGTIPSIVPLNPEQITGGYPHAGHLDNPFSPTKDLNFGMPFYVNLPKGVQYPNNNLFNRNWRKYIEEITNRNSRIVETMVYVNPADWQRWSFRDLFFFDGQYFRLNKVSDYPIGTAELTRCEFLKIKQGAAFVGTTGKVGGGYDQLDDNNDRFPDFRNGVDIPLKRFGWNSEATGTGLRPSLKDWIVTVNGLTQSDIGTPSSGDNFRVAVQWDGADWNLNLIQEP